MAKSSGDGWLVLAVIIIGAPVLGVMWLWKKFGESITNAWNWFTDNWIIILISVVVIIVLLGFAGNAAERKEAEAEAERERIAEEERIERERIAEEKRIERERQEAEEEAERERIAEEERIERERQREERRRKRLAELTEKYNEEIADKIMAGEIWLDQTPEQLTDSWGEPDDKDIKILKTKSKEIWKYDEIGKNRYRKIVTIENGLVIGWEMK